MTPTRKHKLVFNWAAALLAISLLGATNTRAATATKAATGTDLTGATAGVWSGGSGANGSPTSADTATWVSTSLGAGLTLGSSESWGGISVSGALTDISITGASASTLTLGTGGITLANNNLTLNCPLSLGGNQSWNAGSETLTINSNLTDSGSYTLSTAGNVTLFYYGYGLPTATFGDTTISSGTLTVGNTTTFGTLTVSGTFDPVSGSANSTYTMNGLAGSGTITTVNGGGYLRTLSVGNNNASSTFSGVLNQAGNRGLTLNKVGSGTLALTGTSANVEGGGTGSFIVNVTQGELDLGKTSAICLPGSGLITVNGGILKLTGTGGNQISDTKPLTISSGTFDLYGNTEAIDALNGTGGVIDNTDGGTTAALTVGANNSSGAFSGVIQNSGSGATLALVQGGTGTLTLSGASTYGGGTTISAGAIKVGVNNALPTGTTVSFGAAATSGILDLGGYNQTVAGFGLGSGHSWGSSDLIGNSSTSANSVLTLTNNANNSPYTFGGVIQNTLGSGNKNVGLVVTNGTVTLSGVNTYSGATAVNAGNLTISPSGVIGSSSGTAITLNSGGTLTNNSTVATTGGISGTSSLTINSGTVANLNTANNYSGATSVTGTLLLADPNAVLNSAVTLNNGGTLQLRNNSAVSFNSSGAVLWGGGNGTSTTIDVNNNGSGSGNALTLANGITYSYNDTSAGTITSTINVTGGNGYTLTVPNLVIKNTAVASTGSRHLDLDLYPTLANLSLGNVAGYSDVNAVGIGSELVLDGTTTGNQVTGVISHANGGATFNVYKKGAGTWTFSGANTYDGSTSVNAGTLFLGSGGSIGASTTTVSSGATLGSATTSTTTIGAATTYNSGALASFTATGGSPTSVGQISVTGNLTLNANAVTVNVSGASLAPGTYRLLSCSGTLFNTGTFGTPTISGTPLSAGYGASLSVTTGSGGSLNLVVSAITPSGTLAAVNSTYGSYSATPTSFTVSGSSLTPASGNLTVTPPSGYVVSTTSGSGYTTSLSLPYTGGALASTTVYVALANTDTVSGGLYSGNITISGSGATATIATASSTVSPASLTITANNQNKTYGTTQSSPVSGSTAFTTTPSTLPNGDSISSVTLTYSGTGTTAGAAAGATATITPGSPVFGSGVAGNYTITPATGTLTVIQAGTAIALLSPENPAGYRDSVFFTAANLSGVPGGESVVFSTNGVAYSTNALAGGGASSSATTSLPRGTNTITVAYLGDANYIGSTNTLNQIVTNHPPVAGAMTVTRTAGLWLLISLSNLATNWSDADGDLVELTGVNLQSTNGVNLVAVNWTTNLDGSIGTTNAGACIGYTNSPNVNDQISYGISDGWGGTNIGYINIVLQSSVAGTNSITGITLGGTNVVSAFGIPGYDYILERATNLAAAVWIDISTNPAATNGVINAADTFWDLGGVAPSSAFYQLKWQP